MQSLADLLAGLGTLSAVELSYEQVPGYAVPTLSELEPLHERVFELLGFQPRPAPALSKPPEHAGSARPRHQPSHQQAVRNAAISHDGTRRRDLTNSLKQLTNGELPPLKAVTQVGLQP